MSFCSLGFLIFFPVVFLLYYSIPKKYQWSLLLLSSYYFYMCWKPEFILLIIASTLIDYFSARNIEAHPPFKKIWLCVSICSNLSLLFFFKYYGFFSDNVNAVLRFFLIPASLPALNIILPIGISFYTFQTMSYTIEVYRGNIPAEKHLGYFALFVTYFPQLVAGPIETPQALLPQLREEHTFSYESAVYGTKLMAWGFFKKTIVADTAAFFVDAVFNNVSRELNGWTVMIASFLFLIQLYCDFSGYSDIARGCSKIMGVDLMVNFKSPVFFSKSIKEYWQRHHISLTKWFTSYVYIPLGGSRKGTLRKYLNNTVTFLLSGLWHGADWTFVVWGGLHSVYLNVGDFLRKKLRRDSILVLPSQKIQNALNCGITCALACISFIFFRANTISDALTLIYDMARDCTHLFVSLPGFFALHKLGFPQADKALFVNMFLSLAILFLFDYFNEREDVIQRISGFSPALRYALYLGILTVILCMRPASNVSFIYFQF